MLLITSCGSPYRPSQPTLNKGGEGGGRAGGGTGTIRRPSRMFRNEVLLMLHLRNLQREVLRMADRGSCIGAWGSIDHSYCSTIIYLHILQLLQYRKLELLMNGFYTVSRCNTYQYQAATAWTCDSPSSANIANCNPC